MLGFARSATSLAWMRKPCSAGRRKRRSRPTRRGCVTCPLSLLPFSHRFARRCRLRSSCTRPSLRRQPHPLDRVVAALNLLTSAASSAGAVGDFRACLQRAEKHHHGHHKGRWSSRRKHRERDVAADHQQSRWMPMTDQRSKELPPPCSAGLWIRGSSASNRFYWPARLARVQAQ